MVRQFSPLAEHSEALWHAINEAVPQPIVVLDSQMQILLANRAFAECFHVDIEQSIGKSFFEMGEAQWNLSELRRLLNELLPKHSAVDDLQIIFDVPAVGKRTMLVNARAGESNDSRFIVLTFRDITESLLAEQEMRRLNAALTKYADEVSNVNKELEAFSYSVSHDLRSRLRSVDGFSLALLEDYNEKLDDTGQDYLRRIRVAATDMAALIDDLLQLARLGRTPLESGPVDISSLARHVIYDLKAANPGRSVSVEIIPDMKTTGDRKLLRIAMVNLLGNAWKFTSKNSDALIEVGKIERDGETVYFIRDNGVGFDMQYANKLLQPFVRLHAVSDFPGSGIGLATVQRIIQRHQGKLWAEGKINEGATFYFTLGEIQGMPEYTEGERP